MARATEVAGEIFGRLRGIAKQIVEGYGGIFRELAKEHGEVTVLMKRIATTTDEEVKRDVFGTMRAELLSHARAEEKEFYPLLIDKQECRLLVEQAKLDHQEIETILDSLFTGDSTLPGWNELFAKLERAVEAHVEMEENELFPKAKDVLSKDQLTEMERRFETVRKEELESYATLH